MAPNVAKAVILSASASHVLARRRFLPIQAKVRSTTHRLGNTSKPEPRGRRRRTIDLVAKNATDTLELDFDRFPRLFPATTPPAQRRAIIGEWLSEVRTATPGLRLGLRVPSRTAHRTALGLASDGRARSHRGSGEDLLLRSHRLIRGIRPPKETVLG